MGSDGRKEGERDRERESVCVCRDVIRREILKWRKCRERGRERERR